MAEGTAAPAESIVDSPLTAGPQEAAPSVPFKDRAMVAARKLLSTVGVIAALGASAPAAMAEYAPFPYSGGQGRVGAKGDHELAVIPVNFSGGPNPTLGPTNEQINRAMFSAPDSVSNYFADASFGQLQLEGIVFSPVTVQPFLERSCKDRNFIKIGKAANAAVEQAMGVGALDDYDNYTYILPRQSNCINQNNGRVLNGATFGNVDFINSRKKQHEGIYVHELGHEFGLSHTNALHCRSDQGRPVLTPLGGGANCKEVIYQDPFDPMGYAALRATAPIDFGALNKARLGWLQPDNIETVTKTTTVEIAPDEVASEEPQLIRIPYGFDFMYGRQFLYLDFRQPIDQDAKVDPQAPIAAMFKGVTLQEAGPIGYDTPINLGNYIDLIDTRPGTPAQADAPLSPGRTYRDPSTGIAVKTLSVQPDAAKVRIKIPQSMSSR